METTRKEKKRGTLVYIIGAVVIGMILLIMLICGILLSFKLSRVVERFLGEILRRQVTRNERIMKKYDALPWLLDYWSEHPEEIENFRDSLGSLEAWVMENEEDKEFILFHPEDVSSEYAEAMSPQMQKIFAEYCYYYILEDFDTSQSVYVPVISSCFRPEGDSIFVFFYDSSENVGVEDGKILKDYTVESKDSDYYGVVIDSALQGADSPLFRVQDREDRLTYAVPVVQDGKALCILDAYINWNVVNGIVYLVTTSTLPGCILLILFGGLVLMFLLYLMMIRPTEHLQKTVQEYEKTKDSAMIPQKLERMIRKNNEFGALARQFNEMAESIDSYVEDIAHAASEKEKLNTELVMAKNIQRSQLPEIFPAFPDHEEFDLYASMEPAKEVGGDFYDFFMIDDDHLALVIGDVSDKGIPAALMMMVCRSLIRSNLRREKTPAKALHSVNEQISENNTMDMFVTVWLAVVELSTGNVVEVNAGHEKPALARAGGSFTLIKTVHDLAIGSWNDIDFRENTFKIEKGDTIFVYSDGVPESSNTASELFGPQRMLDALNDDPAASPEQQIAHMKETIADFVGEAAQFDDTTMLCFRMNK
jgi:serine phosphatase RsbU (regulator of sigma subunit)